MFGVFIRSNFDLLSTAVKSQILLKLSGLYVVFTMIFCDLNFCVCVIFLSLI